jgi:hypothetical protein
MNYYIKSKHNNQYLLPFYQDLQFTYDLNYAFSFSEEELECVKSIDELIPSNIIKDEYELYIAFYKDDQEFEYIINLSNNIFIRKLLNKDDYLKLKEDFYLSDKKELVHYLIYSYIKSGEPLKSINFNGKKMYFTMKKIKKAKFFIKNYDYTVEYLKVPFPSINNKKFKKILNEILNLI